MKKKKLRRFFSVAQKKAILQEAIDTGVVSKVLEKHRLGDGAFYRWQKIFMPNWDKVFKPKMNTRRHSEESRPRVVPKGDADRASRILELEHENAQLRKQIPGNNVLMELKLPRSLLDSLDEIATKSEEARETVVRVILTMQLMRLQAAGVEAASGSRRSRAATQRP